MNQPKIQHREGPWKVANVGEFDDEVRTITTDTDSIICEVWPIGTDFQTEDGSMPIGEANAQLIAAAPDLLAACQQAVKVISDYIESDDAELCALAETMHEISELVGKTTQTKTGEENSAS